MRRCNLLISWKLEEQLGKLQRCTVTQFPDKEQWLSNKRRLLWVSNDGRDTCIRIPRYLQVWTFWISTPSSVRLI